MPTDTGSNTLKLLSMKYRVDPLNGLNSIGEFGETTAISSTDLEFRKLWGGSFELHSSV